MIEFFKKRWELNNKTQVYLILAIFCINGPLIVFIKKKFINPMLGIEPETAMWIKVVVFFVVLIPIYNLTLFLIGSIFGQQEFFVKFIKKSFLKPFKRWMK